MWQKIGGAALVLALTSCSASTQSTADIEQNIRGDLAKQLKVSKADLTIDCPDSIEWRVGEDFHCIAEDDQGNRVRVTVSMEANDGSYTWQAG